MKKKNYKEIDYSGILQEGGSGVKLQDLPGSLKKIHSLNYLPIIFARLFLNTNENKVILSLKKE
jgi:hypothetical protein